MANVRILRLLAALSVVGLGLASVGVPAEVVMADANAPHWSAGDYWVYVRTSDNRTTRLDVVAREPLALSRTFDTVHVRRAVTTGVGVLTTTVTTEEWTQDGDLGLAKATVALLGTTQVVTYDPPLTQALFPLVVGKAWSVDTSFHIVSLNISIPIQGDASVLSEGSTSVPAGTFAVLAVRENAGANLFAGAYAVQSYAEAAGNWVRRESYNGAGQRTSEEVLTAYRCGACSAVVLIVIAIVVLAAIAIVGFLYLRTRGRRQSGPPAAPPPP